MLKKTNLNKFKKFNFHKFPDKNGRFGDFGGRFVAETLMPLLLNVEDQYKKQKNQRNLKVKLIIILRTTLVDQVLFILLNAYQKN